MKRIFTPLAMLLATAVLCASCLSSEEEEYTYYDDTAITAFTLGTLNKYTHTTTSAGNDSLITTTVTGSNYEFYIDQLQRLIYNPDSLPVGTDASKVVCTISTKNAGTVLIKHENSDSVMYYTSTDSIDFSIPRQLIVYSQSGKTFREYEVRVNVHQQEADDMHWDLFSAEQGQQAWEQFGQPLLSLIPDWTQESLDSDAALLPTEDVTASRFTLRTNANVEQIVVTGNRSLADYPDDTLAVVWSQLVETGENSHAHPWIFHNYTGNRYPLPRLKSLQTVRYDDCLLAIGLNADNSLSDIYESRDGGITWKPNGSYPLPESMKETQAVKMFVDDNQFLWIVTDEEAWRGRVNRLAW